MDHTVTHLGHGYWHQITLGHVYKHHLGAAATVGAVALLQAVAADLRLRGAPVRRQHRSSTFPRKPQKSALEPCIPASRQMIFLRDAPRAVAADLRKLSGLCPLSRRRLFLRDATVVTVTAMFLRGATVVRVGIRSPGLR